MPIYLGKWPVPVNDLAEYYYLDVAHWNFAVERATQKRGNARRLAEAIEKVGYHDPRIVAMVMACVGTHGCGICGRPFVPINRQRYCFHHYHGRLQP